MREINGEHWGSPAEVAQAVGVQPGNVREWVRSGKIAEPDVKRRGRYLFVRALAAAEAERATRGIGRPRGS